jgi:hypothetical protein
MIQPNQQSIDELSNLVRQEKKHTEKECGKWLCDFAWLLLSAHETPGGEKSYFVDKEQMISTGIIDLLIVAEVVQTDETTSREAFVWELKAPQLPLFEIDTHDRACPTKHLFKAENQLLHYRHTVANDGTLKERFNIISQGNVRLGGIIIGKKDKMVLSGREDPEHARILAKQALKIRDESFYRPAGMCILTWDRIISLATNSTLTHVSVSGDPNATVDVLSPINSK